MKNYQLSDFSEIILEGNEEIRQEILWSENQRSACRFGIFSIEAFENDMAAYARRSFPKDAPVPNHATFIHFSPTYRNMSQAQRSWYLYWRGQVRIGQYPETDYPYIQLHATELLSGYGWETPEDGYAQILKLWEAYRLRYNTMDSRFLTWCFDFSMEHGLPFHVPEAVHASIPSSPIQQNMLLSQHISDETLKLPFQLILCLSDYDPQKSAFWKDGHQVLLTDAITKTIRLCDMLIRREHGKGLLQTLAPVRAKTISYIPYEGTFCEKSAYGYNIPMIDYTGGRTLRAYVTEVIRFVENTLRDIMGYRGKLRDVNFPPETAAVVEQFLRKQFSQLPIAAPSPVTFQLDSQQIDRLRQESNAVRDALDVPDAIPEENEADWIEKKTDTVIVPVAAASVPAVPDHSISSFQEDKLSPELAQLMAALKPYQVDILHAVLTSQTNIINQIARQENTMPASLLDSINETAMEIMGDVLIDTSLSDPIIIDFYESELKNALR